MKLQSAAATFAAILLAIVFVSARASRLRASRRGDGNATDLGKPLAPLLGMPAPHSITGMRQDFGKGHEQQRMKRHKPMPEMFLVCPTTSCLRERMTPNLSADHAGVVMVTAGDYECFDEKHGMVSKPYLPEDVEHIPEGYHRWQCLSKHRCASDFWAWKEAMEKESLCDKAAENIEAKIRKTTKLSPFEAWFTGGLGVSDEKVKNHSVAVQEYEEAVEAEKDACLKKAHWEHMAGPILTLEAYADKAKTVAAKATKTLSAAKEHLTNAQMGALSSGEKWYISKGMDIEGLEKDVHRALKAKSQADEKWGKFEMQAEHAEVAGPGILRALRHARKGCHAAQNATRDAKVTKDASVAALRKAENTQLGKMKKAVQPHLDKLKSTEQYCGVISKAAADAHKSYHLCRLGDPKYSKNQKPLPEGFKNMMEDEEVTLARSAENKTKKDEEDEDSGASGPEAEQLEDAEARNVFSTGATGGRSSTGGRAGIAITGAAAKCPTIKCPPLNELKEGCERELNEEKDQWGCLKQPCGILRCKGSN
jgi:hypothetical protein